MPPSDHSPTGHTLASLRVTIAQLTREPDYFHQIVAAFILIASGESDIEKLTIQDAIIDWAYQEFDPEAAHGSLSTYVAESAVRVPPSPVHTRDSQRQLFLDVEYVPD